MSADYYLEDKSRLKGQPKKTIGDYVASCGFMVARRFENLEDAFRSHGRVFLRSEHVQEYDGASGLLDSFELKSNILGSNRTYFSAFLNNSSELKNLDEIKKTYFDINDARSFVTPTYVEYCELMGIDLNQFKEECSFSPWAKIEGYKRTIIEDDAIPERYHVLTFRDDSKKKLTLVSYSIVNYNKKLGNINFEKEFVMPLFAKLKDSTLDLVTKYSDIKRLNNFNEFHCPIMEFITMNGKKGLSNMFLQYHRVRDSNPADFIIDRRLARGEIEAGFVRGATSNEGINCKVTVIYAYHDENKISGDPIFNIGVDEEGSFDTHNKSVFSEIMTRKRKLQIEICEDEPAEVFKLESKLSKLINGHLAISKIFKPQVSVIMPKYDILSEKELTDYRMLKSSKDLTINVNIISDGRRAILKRI
ncbi:MAG: hypothetical protein WC758_00285 [Candidatus Woesearchaeota archaeon]